MALPSLTLDDRTFDQLFAFISVSFQYGVKLGFIEIRHRLKY